MRPRMMLADILFGCFGLFIVFYVAMAIYLLTRKKKKMTPEEKKAQREWERYCAPRIGDYQITLEYKHGGGNVSFSPTVVYSSLAEARVGGEEHLKKETNSTLSDGKVKITKHELCPHCGQGYMNDVTNSLGSVEFNAESGEIKVTNGDGKVAASWKPEDRDGESCTAPNREAE